MRALPVLLFFLAQPFWETKPPDKWTDREIDTILQASPWAEKVGPTPEVLMYLATAAPIEEAEGELRLRTKHPLVEPDPDYNNYLRENREQSIVLAIPYDLPVRFGTGQEQRRMEEECEMLIGRKSFKLVGHFPPTGGDPVLRLVFPREVKKTDKAVTFRLFLPGLVFPEREIEFKVKDLQYRGKLEM
jgi:hypothetical protein